IAIKDGRFAARGAVVAPTDDVARNIGSRWPAVDRQTEGCLGDEGIAWDGFERAAGGIGLTLVVSGHHPDLAFGLDADLRRAEDMTGGVQRYTRFAQREGLAVFMPAVVLFAQPPLEDGQSFGAGMVTPHSRAGVITVAVCDHGGGDG